MASGRDQRLISEKESEETKETRALAHETEVQNHAAVGIGSSLTAEIPARSSGASEHDNGLDARDKSTDDL